MNDEIQKNTIENKKINATNEQKINHLEMEIETQKQTILTTKKQHENLMNTMNY